MNLLRYRGIFVPVALLALCCCVTLPAAAQTPPTWVPEAVDTLPAGVVKLQGFVMNASTAQITVRAKGDNMSLQTFTLSPNASAKMQETIDKGGYQFGDKVTVIYNTANQIALKVKGKPSRPL
jgi:acylphosphatase